MRHLSHEHIVSIYDFYEDDPQHFYMVLELMKGGELLHSTQEKVQSTNAMLGRFASSLVRRWAMARPISE